MFFDKIIFLKTLNDFKKKESVKFYRLFDFIFLQTNLDRALIFVFTIKSDVNNE